MTALNPVMRCGAQIDEVLREHTICRESAQGEDARNDPPVHLPEPERMYSSFPHQLSAPASTHHDRDGAILEPALLIADEPTTALDVTTRRKYSR